MAYEKVEHDLKQKKEVTKHFSIQTNRGTISCLAKINVGQKELYQYQYCQRVCKTDALLTWSDYIKDVKFWWSITSTYEYLCKFHATTLVSHISITTYATVSKKLRSDLGAVTFTFYQLCLQFWKEIWNLSLK